jgi:hypothetical protein
MEDPDTRTNLRPVVIIPPRLLVEARRIAYDLYQAKCYNEAANLLDHLIAANGNDSWSLTLYAKVRQNLPALD